MASDAVGFLRKFKWFRNLEAGWQALYDSAPKWLQNLLPRNGSEVPEFLAGLAGVIIEGLYNSVNGPFLVQQASDILGFLFEAISGPIERVWSYVKKRLGHALHEISTISFPPEYRGQIVGTLIATVVGIVVGFKVALSFSTEIGFLPVARTGDILTVLDTRTAATSAVQPLVDRISWIQREEGSRLGLADTKIRQIVSNYFTRRLKRLGRSGILRSLEGGSEPFPMDKLIRILESIRIREGGGYTDFSEAALSFLQSKGARAGYMVDPGAPPGKAGIFLFGPNPSKQEVLEELLHYVQHKRTGFAKELPEHATLLQEIDAQNELLRLGERWGWPEKDMARLKRALNKWTKDLEAEYRRMGQQSR